MFVKCLVTVTTHYLMTLMADDSPFLHLVQIYWFLVMLLHRTNNNNKCTDCYG